MKKKILIGIGITLTLAALFFLAAHETHISREFVTECDTRPIRW